MSDDLINIPSFLKRASQQTGFDRERYVEANIPDDWSNVVVFVFFGDLRSESILSMLILHQYIKKFYKNKYFIVCSWQGHAGLFPYADEFWSIGDQMTIKDLFKYTDGFHNASPKYINIIKNFTKYFNLVLDSSDIEKYYFNGLTKDYFDTFGEVVKFFPALPSPKIDLNKELNLRNNKSIFIYPIKTICKWNKSGFDVTVGYDFWVKLIQNMLDNNLVPVIYQNYMTYDVSKNFGDKCLYITDNNILSLMSSMRLTTCVLDVFSGIARIAVIARCPFVVLDERMRYINAKESEINDLCGNSLCKYIFSFSSILNGGNYEEMSNLILYNMKEFIVKLNGHKLLSSAEFNDVVSYDIVKKHKQKKFGMHFIKVERLKI